MTTLPACKCGAQAQCVSMVCKGFWNKCSLGCLVPIKGHLARCPASILIPKCMSPSLQIMAKTPLTPQINWPTLANSRADQKRSEENPVFTITFLKVTAAVKLSALVPSSGGGDGFVCPLTISEHVVYFPFIIGKSVHDNASGRGSCCTVDFQKTAINASVTCTRGHLSVVIGDMPGMHR